MVDNSFERLLKIGRGKAVVLLREHGGDVDRDLLLYACLHNLAYDPQSEGNRAQYMFDMLQLVDDQAWFRDRILAALQTTEDDSDRWQVFELARMFAENGDAGARNAIYAAFEAHPLENDVTPAFAIVDLDGVEGFLFVADRVGPMLANLKPLDVHWFMEHAKQEIGSDELQQAIDRTAVNNDRVAAFLKVADEAEAERKAKNATSRTLKSYVNYKQDILERPTDAVRFAFYWGKRASHDEIAQAAADLLLDHDRDRLLVYLRIFRRRVFPLDPARLIALAESDDDEIANAALGALENVSHPDARALAIRFLDERKHETLALDLLVNNYVDGDYQRIAAVLDRADDDDTIHAIGWTVRKLLDQEIPVDAEPVLIDLYERGPCALCRSHFVEGLIELDALPGWIAEECAYDSNSSVRSLIDRYGCADR